MLLLWSAVLPQKCKIALFRSFSRKSDRRRRRRRCVAYGALAFELRPTGTLHERLKSCLFDCPSFCRERWVRCCSPPHALPASCQHVLCSGVLGCEEGRLARCACLKGLLVIPKVVFSVCESSFQVCWPPGLVSDRKADRHPRTPSRRGPASAPEGFTQPSWPRKVMSNARTTSQEAQAPERKESEMFLG